MSWSDVTEIKKKKIITNIPFGLLSLFSRDVQMKIKQKNNDNLVFIL
jgi:hypothetical protein